MATPTLTDYIAAHDSMYDYYRDLCGRATSEQLAVQSLCADWDVRGVITHAIGIEAVLDGWEPSTDGPPSFERLSEFAAATADADPATFATRIDEVITSRRAHLGAMPAEIVDAPSITPTGISTYGDFLRVRVFDLWVHARDIAIPLGDDLGAGGLTAQMALEEVAGAAGYIVGKKIGLPDGKSIVFHVTGGVERDIAVVVDGRAAVVDSVADPDVEITADVETFIMLACGRIDPQSRIDSGQISWSGDDEWGERAARNLAYTM